MLLTFIFDSVKIWKMRHFDKKKKSVSIFHSYNVLTGEAGRPESVCGPFFESFSCIFIAFSLHFHAFLCISGLFFVIFMYFYPFYRGLSLFFRLYREFLKILLTIYM
jgi:hypothetical protein